MENHHFELSVSRPDRGYFAEASATTGFQQEDSIKILIAHSLGLHLLPPDLFAQTDLLVAISSFSSFHGPDAVSQKRSRRALRLMKEKLNAAPMDVIDDFYTNCYHPLLTRQALLRRGSAEKLDGDLLYKDLDFMDQNVLPPELLCAPKHTLFLHGSEDSIVSQEHSLALHKTTSQSSLIVFEGVGHALPFTHAAPCWFSIRQSLLALSRSRVT